MRNKKRYLAGAALISFSFLSVSAARAENPPCYTNASLQGSWSVVATYSANVGIGIGQRVLDGNGNWTGVFVLNAPTDGSTTRTLTTNTQTGTYTVNCDGSGTFVKTTVSSAGTTAGPSTDDFVITKAVVKNGQFVATEIVDAQRTASTLAAQSGLFVTRVHKRLPDRPGPTQP
jgi:hypothetical protein